ncbi:MAG: hypothetical protein H8E26_08435 [FCB group bacterium]|nr:hypothetical protein [FCB group bacterium]MBL7028410.1 hypothetical protein [Candidatus Neomarinimicrobiota bacterium]MBL7122324.1 hypothetical protein [Candidatus Neomarinimicrobiota bacterium]
MTTLKTHIEFDTNLARWLNVQEVALVREDLLPNGGGKKRRALAQFVTELEDVKHIHLLSYAGSHTAYTLSSLLPDVMIHLYGTHYGGGLYEKEMTSMLDSRANIIQKVSSSWTMSLAFNRQRRESRPGHHFMRIGGSLGFDFSTQSAVEETIRTVGEDFHHVVAVASGDLLTSVARQTNQVTGVLTQPLGIRILKYISLKKSSGIWKSGLNKRIKTMRAVREITGQTWDPIFMGTLFSYLIKKKKLPPKLCIWITCPAGIDW